MNSIVATPFKKLFSTENQPDGSVCISYKEKNRSFGPFWAILAAVFVGGLVYSIANAITSGWLESSLFVLPTFFAVFIGAYWALALQFFWLKKHILIKPGDSITANGKTFPINELSKIWVQTTVLGGYAGIFATGHGQDFALTGELQSESLANAIQKEIQKVLKS